MVDAEDAEAGVPETESDRGTGIAIVWVVVCV